MFFFLRQKDIKDIILKTEKQRDRFFFFRQENIFFKDRVTKERIPFLRYKGHILRGDARKETVSALKVSISVTLYIYLQNYVRMEL